MIKVIRIFFVLACLIMGVIWAYYLIDRNCANNGKAFEWNVSIPWMSFGALVGVGVAVLMLFLLRFITQEVFERISPALVAIVLGMGLGYFLAKYIITLMPESSDPQNDKTLQVFITCSFILIFGFAGILLGLTRASNWETLIKAVSHRALAHVTPKIVDTSVIIDGRILDVCKTGFMEGTLIVPRFVLRELQNIADSADSLRRLRGRRGLDILKVLQEPDSKVDVQVVEDDPDDIHEVDGKLVRLAIQYRGRILTNDLNLNKVAQIEGVQVLNINDLANALKPAVLPDELMRVRIVREGKEVSQGVGYLDDGTMVVVDGGKEHVGKEVSVLVTSVLQTTAGRMIFTKLQSVAL